MALENTVAKYTVQIVQDGTTAPAVAEFNNLRTAAQGAAQGTSTATAGLRELRETSMLTRESTRVLAESSILLGGNLGEVARGALAASEAMRILRGRRPMLHRRQPSPKSAAVSSGIGIDSRVRGLSCRGVAGMEGIRRRGGQRRPFVGADAKLDAQGISRRVNKASGLVSSARRTLNFSPS